MNENRTRDHLANERTYLAWLRTAIALMGFGVIIVRLRYLQPLSVAHTGHGWMLGIAFTVLGLLLMLLANAQYFHVRRAIESNSYQPQGRWVLACTIAVLVIGAGVLYFIFTSPAPGAPSSNDETQTR